jgi:hypothetical protein
MTNDKPREPMGGAGVPETSVPQPQRQDLRNVWAIDVLVQEVRSLFKTGFYAHSPNWLAANMVVVFNPEEGEWEDMALVLPAIEDDERVALFEMDEKANTITVQMVSNAILYDTRDSFGLALAAEGLDREITPDDLTSLASALSSEDEGFISTPPRTPINPNDPNASLIIEDFNSPVVVDPPDLSSPTDDEIETDEDVEEL